MSAGETGGGGGNKKERGMYKFTEIGRQNGKYKGTVFSGYKKEGEEYSVSLITTGFLSSECM
jgi:hypothetical protein